MAYISSGTLSPSADYALGEYTLQLRHRYDEDEDVTGVVCRITKDGETAVAGIDIDGEVTIESRRVDANDTTADVYVTYSKSGYDPTIIDVDLSDARIGQQRVSYHWSGYYWPNLQVYADFHARVSFDPAALNSQYASPLTLSYYAAKDIWWVNIDIHGNSQTPDYGPVYNNQQEYFDLLPQGHASEKKTEEVLVARFAIDLHDAGGTGPNSPWHDPGDYDESHDPDDPTEPRTTLNLTINGALSGRHNDPLHDTSYSYVPAERATQTVYGSGGDGGNGGGGGAGASTINVRKFATSRADSKSIVCKPKRHGYGSGGGAGAKGGDGCVLIFW